nr:hypothetical protein [Variovorax boronicumulans]
MDTGDGTPAAVLKATRGRDDGAPAVMLMARGQLSERIQDLDVGTDDGLVEPFQVEELSAARRPGSRACRRHTRTQKRKSA